MQRHGWTLLFHEGFIEQLRKVQAAAVPLSDSEPQQFDGDANAKLFQALSHRVMDAVPGGRPSCHHRRVSIPRRFQCVCARWRRVLWWPPGWC